MGWNRPRQRAVCVLVVSRTGRLVALASLIIAAIVYALPAFGAADIQWRTEPGLRGLLGSYRFPGYLWPSSLLAPYAVALLPLLLPRRLQSSAVGALGELAMILVFLLSILFVAWLVVTPMFS